jgi:hypothetical protein
MGEQRGPDIRHQAPFVSHKEALACLASMKDDLKKIAPAAEHFGNYGLLN